MSDKKQQTVEILIPPADPSEWKYQSYLEGELCQISHRYYSLMRSENSEESSVKWKAVFKGPAHSVEPNPQTPVPLLWIDLAIVGSIAEGVAVCRFHAWSTCCIAGQTDMSYQELNQFPDRAAWAAGAAS